LYEGPELPSSRVGLIYLGDTTVRSIDGRFDYAVAFTSDRIELAPGRHRVVLGFERAARSIGLRDMPARRGEGTCTLDFVVEGGQQYWLGSRPLGTDWTMRRWDGKWEAWARKSVDAEDNAIAHCDSEVRTRRAVPRALPVASAVPPSAAAAGDSAVPVVVAPVPAAVAAVPPPAVPVVSERAEWIRLGTWNVRSLGAEPGRDYDAMAAVIDDNFDILTLTEVAYVGGGHSGYDRLLAGLGAGWAGMVTETPLPWHRTGDGDSSDAEYYAILYRRENVRPCDGWDGLRLVSEFAGGSVATEFLRQPAFACFAVVAGDGTAGGVDFMLAAYRATSGDADAIAAEVGHIDAVFAIMAAARPGEGDLIVAGEFNLDSSELALVTTAADRTAGSGSTLNLLGEPTASLHDHILVRAPRAMAEMVGNGIVLDVRSVAESPREFRRAVSDHLPVMVRIRTAASDRD